jgi:hypothetical protein
MPAKILHQTIDGVECKRCSQCTEWKPLTQYTKETRRPDGLCYRCIICWKNYRNNHRDVDSEYRRNNREKVNTWRRTELARKRENPDEKFIQKRIKENIARRMRFILRGTQKSQKTCELLGCSPEEFKSHLESTFTEGMTWDNYGEWHIDHIIPCAAFDQTDDTERMACWNRRNLRALWGQENMEKSDAYDQVEKETYMSSFTLVR